MCGAARSLGPDLMDLRSSRNGCEGHAPANRMRGHISYWNDKRGFGFLVPVGTHDRSAGVFVHIGDFSSSGLSGPEKGEHFTFKVKAGQAGRLRAFDLEPFHGDCGAGAINVKPQGQ
jgi:cold shock CspA family protein